MVVRSCSLLLVLAALLPALGRAQSQPEAPPAASDALEVEAEPATAVPADQPAAAAEESRLAFDRGLELLRERKWAEAETQFRVALARVPRASAQYDLALVLYEQGRLRESAATLHALLSTASFAHDQRYRDFAQTLLDRIAGQQAVLRLHVEPASTMLEVDGERVDGSGAERSVPLHPGLHRIALSAAGFHPQVLQLKAEPRGELRREVELLPADRLLPSASDARVRPVDGIAPGLRGGGAAPPAQRSTLASIGPWLTIALGGAVLASALVTGIAARRADGEFTQDCPSHANCDPRLKPKRDHIARLGTATDILLVSGSALVAGGIAWRVLATVPDSRGKRGELLLTATAFSE